MRDALATTILVLVALYLERGVSYVRRLDVLLDWCERALSIEESLVHSAPSLHSDEIQALRALRALRASFDAAPSRRWCRLYMVVCWPRLRRDLNSALRRVRSLEMRR